MRQLMDLFRRENPLDYVTTDDRWKELLDVMQQIREYDPSGNMTREKYDYGRKLTSTFTECISGLEEDYDVPAEIIRQYAISIFHTTKVH